MIGTSLAFAKDRRHDEVAGHLSVSNDPDDLSGHTYRKIASNECVVNRYGRRGRLHVTVCKVYKATPVHEPEDARGVTSC
jgi:hypothetical protein